MRFFKKALTKITGYMVSGDNWQVRSHVTTFFKPITFYHNSVFFFKKKNSIWKTYIRISKPKHNLEWESLFYIYEYTHILFKGEKHKHEIKTISHTQ